MAKKSNAIPTVKISIATTRQNGLILDWLIKRGQYGKTRSEVAERLLGERLRDFTPDAKFDPTESDNE